MQEQIKNYMNKLTLAMSVKPMQDIQILAEALLVAWREDRNIYLCGNGGSAGNAIHLANDFIYGTGVKNGKGLRVEALSANAAVLTCLANDVGYENIFSEQIRVKGNPDDVLVVLSGSGNSPNIIEAIKIGNAIGMKTFALLGYSGGQCKELVQNPIHFEVDDMQIAEDLQLIVGHLCMKWLSEQKLNVE